MDIETDILGCTPFTLYTPRYVCYVVNIHYFYRICYWNQYLSDT